MSTETGQAHPGQWWDYAANLHYNFFRTYDPATGRYLEADPIGQAGGVNLYAYARNSPSNNIDSHGLIVGSLLSQAAGKLLNRNAEEIAFNATFLEALLGAAAIESEAQEQLACRLRSQHPDFVDAARQAYLLWRSTASSTHSISVSSSGIRRRLRLRLRRAAAHWR